LKSQIQVGEGRAKESAATLYTVGHSNHPLEHFLALLKTHRIALIADVRSSPYCKYAAHFDAEPLKRALGTAGVEYLFLGKELGGRPAGAEFYDAEGYVLYERLAAAPLFQEGLARLRKELAARRVAVLCSEEDPAECHRRLLLARVLRARGVGVLHLRGDGRVQTEEELARALDAEKSRGQLLLFEVEEKPAWKSTRSVSPRSPPPSSSAP
jgi:uncharacterized protein (DUF488 family)